MDVSTTPHEGLILVISAEQHGDEDSKHRVFLVLLTYGVLSAIIWIVSFHKFYWEGRVGLYLKILHLAQGNCSYKFAASRFNFVFPLKGGLVVPLFAYF